MSIFRHPLTVVLATFMIASVSYAQVMVQNPWVRATVAQQTSTGAFMLLTAKSDSKLIGATSTVADQVEIHKMTMEDEVMKMRQIPELALAANQPVALKPGGYHIMLIGLKRQINVADSIPLTLSFEDKDGNRRQVDIQATVRTLQGGHSHKSH
ncbi:transporter [Advenella sp. S44]|uniref:copper chaperone PCu(A)C n=1 Tax=Advenella sp. S44 TaxID=1982755 RepID=UPI000C2A61A4|nr:copper chaperone PCu(A)C [Advenella sp. S44]PJX25802.1 transporter [Advenella sp. S44]